MRTLTTEQIAVLGRRRLACRRCPTPCANPPRLDLAAACPLDPPRWGAIVGGDGRVGLGDVVETIAKPFARAFKMDCLDANANLKPESPCGKNKGKLNSVRLWRKPHA